MKTRQPRSATPCTQAAVARHCGVSRSTVAAVLRGDPASTGVNLGTHQRVMKVIAELGYRPNAAAAMLRSGRTHSVGIAVPNMEFIGNAMTSQIIRGIGSRAMELGYTFTIACYEEGDIRSSFHRMVRESRFDGVFILALSQEDVDPRARVMRDLGIPYIALESQVQGASSVNFDNIGGGKAIVRHLLNLGRRRIAFIGHQAKALWSAQRYEGYRQALREKRITLDPALVIPTRYPLIELGQVAIAQLIQDKIAFDAAVCVSDLTALAAIRALRMQGLRVPQDVSVTGYDDMATASLAIPALTTIRQDGRAMGRTAMTMLHEQISGNSKPHHEQLPVKLIVRESCGATTPTEVDV